MNSYLKEFRKSKKISQVELAKKLEVSYSHYVKLENGFVKPSFKLLKKIKDVFSEVDMNRFFE